MTTPTQEAAAILTRLLEALARRSGATLNAKSRQDIERACELLASAGAELEQLLDEAPAAACVSPAEAAIDAAHSDPGYQEWRRRRNEQERRGAA